MFFSSAPSLPFENLREGMAMYPKWKMMIAKGEEIFVEFPARNGEKLFQEYIQRIEDGHEGRKCVIFAVDTLQ